LNSMAKISQTRISSPFLSGLVYSFLWLGAGAIVLSLLLAFMGMKEESVSGSVYPVHALAVLMGGMVSGRRAGSRGWYHGGMMGLVYGLIVALIGFLGFDAETGLALLWIIFVSFGAGAVGGMIGVNLKR